MTQVPTKPKALWESLPIKDTSEQTEQADQPLWKSFPTRDAEVEVEPEFKPKLETSPSPLIDTRTTPFDTTAITGALPPVQVNYNDLIERVGKSFLKQIVEFPLPLKEKRTFLPMSAEESILKIGPGGKIGFVDQEEIARIQKGIVKRVRGTPESRLEVLGRKQEELQERLTLPPPVTVAEKVAETIGGLTAFITRLAILSRLGVPLISRIPPIFRAPFIWEVENTLGGGKAGEGAAMAFGIRGIQAIPLKGILGTATKTSTLSAAFAGLAAAQGADEIDIYINAAIPWVFQGSHTLKRQLAGDLRKARSSKELFAALDAIDKAQKKVRTDLRIPPEYEPTIDEIMESLKKYDAQLTGDRTPRQIKDERALRAKDMRAFRAASQEIPEAEPAKEAPPVLARIQDIRTKKALERVSRRAQAREEQAEWADFLQDHEANPREIVRRFFTNVFPKLNKAEQAYVKNVILPRAFFQAEVGDALSVDAKGRPVKVLRSLEDIATAGLEDQTRMEELESSTRIGVAALDQIASRFGEAFQPDQNPLIRLTPEIQDRPTEVSRVEKSAGEPPKLTTSQELAELERVVDREIEDLRRAKAPDQPDVIAKVGPERAPVVENDIPKHKQLRKDRPLARDFDEFAEELRLGIIESTSEADPDPRAQYNYRLNEGTVKPRKGRKAKKQALSVADQPAGGAAKTALEEVTHLEELFLMEKAVEQLPEHEQIIMRGLRGGETHDTLAKQLGLTPEQVAELQNIAIHHTRQILGMESPETTYLQARRRNDPSTRRGGGIAVDLLTLPVRLPYNLARGSLSWAARFVHAEAMEMIDAVGRTGGTYGVGVAAYMKHTVGLQKDLLGELNNNQVKTQKIFRSLGLRSPITFWRLQEERPLIAPNKIGLIHPDAQKTTYSRIIDLVENRNPKAPMTPNERVVVLFLRNAARITGDINERVGLTQRGAKGEDPYKFRRTPGGESFLSFSTQEFFDIMVKGPEQADHLFERIEYGYWEANQANPRTRTLKQVQDIFRDTIRPLVTASNPHAGFRQIGPEIARIFDRRPSGVLTLDGKRNIPLLVTEPRAYLDSLYMSTAMRGGFLQAWGQDGKMIQAVRDRLHAKGGNVWAFDNAIRALSDIPPTILSREHLSLAVSPADAWYNIGRGLNAVQNALKQVMLTATAIIQVSENPGIAGEVGFGPMIRGLRDVITYEPGRRVIMQELDTHRVRTRDVVNLIVDRRHFLSSFVNRFAGVLSRAHGNQLANEMLNETTAAAASRVRMLDVVERAIEVRKGNTTPREADIGWLRRLRYTEKEAIRLASGLATEKEYWNVAQRSTTTLVRTTATMAEKSLFRNTRTYRALVPFTQFFSNRAAQFGTHVKDTSTQGLRWSKSKTIPEFNRNSARFATATFAFAKWAVGIQAAGIVGTFLWAYIREGSEGIKNRTVEAQNDIMGFLYETFVWGTFGPVYGVLNETIMRSLRKDEPAEDAAIDGLRVIMPLSIALDLNNVIRGTGQFSDMTVPDRTGALMRRYTPILNTIPGRTAMTWLGFQVQSTESIAANSAFWRWKLKPENESIPPRGGTPGSTTAAQKQYRIHMKKAFRAQMIGKDPMPHFFRAYAADPGNISQAILARWKLVGSGMNDAKRASLKASMTPQSYQVLIQEDILTTMMALQMKDFSVIGVELKEAKRLFENLDLEGELAILKALLE